MRTVGLAAIVMITSVGEAAVSGVSLVDTLNILIISILSALCTGGAVVCAQYIGRQGRTTRATSARQLLYITLIFSLAVSAVLLCAPRFFIRVIFGAVEASVAESARVYLIFSAISIPFLAVYNSCAAVPRDRLVANFALRLSRDERGQHLAQRDVSLRAAPRRAGRQHRNCNCAPRRGGADVAADSKQEQRDLSKPLPDPV
ncbi:MAG: MATE family efflux transporter [Eubacteriales bacterium]